MTNYFQRTISISIGFYFHFNPEIWTAIIASTIEDNPTWSKGFYLSKNGADSFFSKLIDGVCWKLRRTREFFAKSFIIS